MDTEADDILRERPVLATAAVAAVSALAYVAVQVVLDGVVDPVETAIFVLVFTLVYVGGNRYLRGRAADESAE
jgi:hypothetical protein